ncbi:hypothetical protein B0H19DRAFT_932108, partial [Mycena capillaripes]
QISKASILKDLMQNRSLRLSTDRTKCVAGIPAFPSQSPSSHITFDHPTGAPSLRVGNPIATIVECNGNSFLAVGQVNTIISGLRSMDSILMDLLSDRVTKISYQIFQLVPANPKDDPTSQYDWKWSLGFESRSIHDVPGHLIHPLNPTVSNLTPGKPTYLFASDVLITVAANIDSQLLPVHYNALPEVQHLESFPYRCGEFGGHASQSSFECKKCFPAVPIQTNNYQRVLEHNGVHILFDESIKAVDQPCGLCLRPFPMCRFVFLKGAGTVAARQIDWARSTCLNPLKFQMAAAMKSSEKSPCTNYLILCPLHCGVVVWTYNLIAHLKSSLHNLRSFDNIPSFYRRAESELDRMRAVWDNRQNYPKARKTKKKQKAPLRISDAHRSIMAMRYVNNIFSINHSQHMCKTFRGRRTN